MRLAGWILVIVGFMLGFVLGFGEPLALAVPALAPDGAPGAVAGWVLTRPSWVVPMLLGVALLTISGWLRREPEQA